MRKLFRIAVIISVILVSNSCKKKHLKDDSRSFYLGVTPWPPDFTNKGDDLSYGFINDNCDMVSHHFDDGVPWEEAYSDLPMPQKLIDDVNKRRQRTPTGKKILLSVAPLKISRKERAAYYGSSPNSAYVNTWSGKHFNDTTVALAYVKFITYLAGQLHPDFINYGVESNSGDWNASDFSEYKQFLSFVHTKLKILYPSIPCFVSFMVTPDPRFLDKAKELEPYTDWITLSAYPYSYVGSPVHGSSSPALIPSGLFQSFADVNSSKPFAIAETGYIAQDLNLSGLSKVGTTQWQEDYVNYLFDFCKKNKAKFIIWFCAYDYDAAINSFSALGLNQELFMLWKDTGFYDENLVQRPSCSVWKQWMELPVQ